MKYFYLFATILVNIIQFFTNKTLPGFISRKNKYFKEEMKMYKSNVKIQSKLNITLKNLIYMFKLKGKTVFLEMASIKNPTSFRRKLMFKRNKDISLMDDVIRASIAFEDMETLYEFGNKLKQLYLVRGIFDNFKRSNISYKACLYKLTDLFSEARNMFEIQLQLCQSYFIHKYTHDFYKIVRNIEHLILHGNTNIMKLKIPINKLIHSYNPYPFFIIKQLQGNFYFQQLTGREIIIKEVKIAVKRQLKLAETKTCLKKYVFLFAFMKEQYQKLKDSKFNTSKLEHFKNFMKLLTNKIYNNASEITRKVVKCEIN